MLRILDQLRCDPASLCSASGRNPRRFAALGNAYQDSGRNPRRFAALGNAYQDSGRNPRRFAALGNAYQDSGRNPRRFAALGNAYQDSGRNPRRFAALGNAYQDRECLQRQGTRTKTTVAAVAAVILFVVANGATFDGVFGAATKPMSDRIALSIEYSYLLGTTDLV